MLDDKIIYFSLKFKMFTQRKKNLLFSDIEKYGRRDMLPVTQRKVVYLR